VTSPATATASDTASIVSSRSKAGLITASFSTVVSRAGNSQVRLAAQTSRLPRWGVGAADLQRPTPHSEPLRRRIDRNAGSSVYVVPVYQGRGDRLHEELPWLAAGRPAPNTPRTTVPTRL
jgi:hypothetical protein